MKARVPVMFWIPVAVYVVALSYDVKQRWNHPKPLGWTAPMQVSRGGGGFTAEFLAPRVASARLSQPVRLGLSKPQSTHLDLTLEDPLAQARLEFHFPAARHRRGWEMLRVPLPPGAWVRDLEVEVGGKAVSPEILLTSERPQPWTDVRQPANDMLELPVPTPDHQPLTIRLRYLMNLGSAAEVRVPLPEIPSGPTLHFSGKLNPYTKNSGVLKQDPAHAGPGDFFVRRFNGGSALQGKEWCVVMAAPATATGQAPAVGEPEERFAAYGDGPHAVYWLKRSTRHASQIRLQGLPGPVAVHNARYLNLDSWADWVQVGPAVYRGQRPPDGPERQHIRAGKILTPFSRYRFGSLPAGAIRPGRAFSTL